MSADATNTSDCVPLRFGDGTPEKRAMTVLARGLHATVPSVDMVRCESAARNLLERLFEHGMVVRELGDALPAGHVGFSPWPVNGGWEQSMYELFRQFPRVEMEMTKNEWGLFSSSLERQGITAREVEWAENSTSEVER